jgi:hypothetical protein
MYNVMYKVSVSDCSRLIKLHIFRMLMICFYDYNSSCLHESILWQNIQVIIMKIIHWQDIQVVIMKIKKCENVH